MSKKKSSKNNITKNVRKPVKAEVMPKEDKSILSLLPIIFALAVIPLVVLTKDYTTNLTGYIWFQATEINQIDSFEYTKSVLVIIVGLISAIMIASRMLGLWGKKSVLEGRDKLVYIFAGIYSLFVILSSLFAKQKDLAFGGGGYNQWQSMWVLLGYVMLFLAAYTVLTSEHKVYTLLKCFMVSTAVIGLVGVLQTAGHNPLAFEFIQKIMTSQSSVNKISFSQEFSQVILTFNNPNYSGVYLSTVIPLVGAIAFILPKELEGVSHKWILSPVFAGIVEAELLVSLVGAESSASAITLAVCIIIAVATVTIIKISTMLTDKIKVFAIIGGAVIVIAIGLFGAVNSTIGKQTLAKFKKGERDTRNLVNMVNNKDNSIWVEFRNGETFTVYPQVTQSGEVSGFTAKDAGKKDLAMNYDESKFEYSVNDDRFKAIKFKVINFNLDNQIKPGFKVLDEPNAIEWNFMVNEGKVQYFTPFGKFMSLHKVERFGFQESENFASRRGYIYSRSIPLLPKYFFTGVGPNSFIIAFPNDDFVGSKRVGGKTKLVDKPHNMLLNTWITTGGISFIAYAMLWILYIIGSVKIVRKFRLKGAMAKISFGLMLSAIGHAIVGVTNDPVVGTQLVYWILLGCGYATNFILSKTHQETKYNH
ncbi:O-antigen ligase family protein [Eubacterium xylanophilum]|uniref:O-antigen ligase family protein n=1 Tax=Eubacterium xylanophilum TaxID=39497 RepID=UPI00047EEBBD|nr:O-antigen ligase family protein [Eubacterium xylanophilum]